MAENGLDGDVIGVAFDGTGYGTDGKIWGGEFLVARYAGFERYAHLRYVPLAGGDAAVREPWRAALAFATCAAPAVSRSQAPRGAADDRDRASTRSRRRRAAGCSTPWRRSSGCGRRSLSKGRPRSNWR